VSSDAEVSIRSGGAELIPRLGPLWTALHAYHASVAPQLARIRSFRTADESWSVRRRQYEHWLATEDGQVFLAEQESLSIGYALVRIVAEGPTLAAEQVGELASLSVLPARRGSGVGSLLIGAVHEWLAARGVTAIRTSVMTNNLDADRFYRRFGMIELSVDLIGPVPATRAAPAA
jgi:ribosomal protein S18 acetylase RimI-like enzyme